GVPAPELDRLEQTATADLAEAELPGQRSESIGQVGAPRGDRLEKRRLPDGLDDRAADGGHQGIAVEGAALVAGLEAAHALRRHERGERDAAAEPLADGDDVGLDAGVLIAEEAAGAADARLDLVDDEEDPALRRQRAQGAQVVVAGLEDAGLPLDGLQH